MAVTVNKEACIGCEACVGACLFAAIKMVDGKAEITDACTSCGACVDICPVQAIERGEVAEVVPAADLDSYKNVLVYIEINHCGIQGVSLELLGQGRILADKLGHKLTAVLVGSGVSEFAEQIIHNGADEAYVVDKADLAEYHTESFTNAICTVVNKYKPNAILIGATHQGRDLGPRIAARLKTGLCADCTNLDIDEDSKLVLWTRPAFGGNIMATIICPNHRPQMGTVRPNVFKKPAVDTSRTGTIVAEVVDSVPVRTTLLEATAAACGLVNLEEAEIIVSGGRGLGSAENYEMVKELATVLGGTFSGSRAIVEEGWIEHQRQVGQSGKTVGPKIYIACGISGAIQHVAGMSSSDYIIAINKDANAPIFKVCDLGIVGDVKDVVPVLISKIKAIKK